MTDVFQDLKAGFLEQQPNREIRLSFGGSQALRTQIEHGAKANLFVSANSHHIKALEDQSLIDTVAHFAKNRVVLATHINHQNRIRTPEDLLKIARLIIGAKDVPIGAYTLLVFDHLERIYGHDLTSLLRSRIVSHENNVRLIRAKVEMGEADAGFVYRTDALSRPELHIVQLPSGAQVKTPCMIGVLNRSRSVDESAQQFYHYVFSEAGQSILRAHHFLPVGEK
mgnify:CR=1 FL=1|tara:strand:- start:563 stop:1237 length:675 start_codon:yes stop_codon:yes gene_type:complete